MIKNVIYIMLSVVFISCSSDNETPSDIIPQKKMSDIMWDMMRSQILAYEIARKDSSVTEPIETKVLSQKVFNIYKIDSAYFNKSYNWYVQHPAVLKIIFDSLYTQKQRENDRKLEKETMQDSLKIPGIFEQKWY